MSRKSRGIAAERELIHQFWDEGWAAFRAAGSGSMKYPCPDVIAGHAGRKLSLEVKKTKKNRKYFTAEEVKALNVFSDKFGSESWVGVRFYRTPWFFLPTHDLDETPKNFVVSKAAAERKGFTFQELISIG